MLLLEGKKMRELAHALISLSMVFIPQQQPHFQNAPRSQRTSLLEMRKKYTLWKTIFNCRSRFRFEPHCRTSLPYRTASQRSTKVRIQHYYQLILLVTFDRMICKADFRDGQTTAYITSGKHEGGQYCFQTYIWAYLPSMIHHAYNIQRIRQT